MSKMSENNGAPDDAGWIRTGDVSGMMVVGSGNTMSHLQITAEFGSTVIVPEGSLPDPVKRPSISPLLSSAAQPLIGRARDVQVLQGAIETGQLVQIWGASEVGKSSLLRHLARTMPPGPEGAAHIEAGGRTADDIAQAIFDISFHAPPNYKPSLEVLKEHLKTLRLRIYLDDAGLDEKDLRRLFDMAGQSTFVFTSQQPSAVDGVHAIRLDGLTASAAAELLETLLSRELRPDEVPIVGALCAAVDGNPLRLRHIALSAETGKGLPGIADLPELLPALLNKLQPHERDLLYLLGSLSGAELAPRHLRELVHLPDTDALADGLVRHGLLLASETGYSCPPDVAECVLNMRKTEFPADQLCRALTAWVEAGNTTPDDVAAHFQALDVAVLRAERNGHAQLGAALARAASPKLALSRQFDAWGSLLGVGWAAAKTAGDKEGEEFFLREARTRRRAIGRGAMTAALVLEADVLWRELTALHAHSAAHQVAGVASVTAPPVATPPVHVFTPTTHGAVPTQAIPHSTAVTHATPVASAPAHAPLTVHAPRPVVDLSHTSAAHVTGAHSAAAPIPQRIDLSAAHAPAAHSTHAVTPAVHATSAGHTTATAVGAGTVKGGMSALALACTIGLAAVLGVGTMVYANDQANPSPAVAASPFTTPDPVDDTSVADDTSAAVDPVCANGIPDLSSELLQFNTDAAIASDAVDSYNSDMASYNSGATSTVPDDSMLLSDVGTVISDLRSVESTLQGAISQAQDSSVAADLGDMLTATQQVESLYQSYENDPTNSGFDTASQASAMTSASDRLLTDCGA
jgi:energy-coupling factor transporter ATP-binding protein EcfA2